MRFLKVIKQYRILFLLWMGVVPTNFVAAQQMAASHTAESVPSGEKRGEYHEDFSTPSLKGSAFFPIPPVVGQIDDYPQNSFIRERWQLDWRPSDPIDIYIVTPRGIKNPPVILYLYTYPGNTDRFKSDDWCAAATSNGFAAVGFVSAYTGHRREMRALKEMFLPELQESLSSTVHDVQLILDYLKTRNDLDMNRVGMFGQGSGGSIAILASAVEPRIKAVDVLNPWGDWPEFFSKSAFIQEASRAKYTAPEYLSKVSSLDPLAWLPKMKAQSVRIQDVRMSGPMPDELQQSLEEAAPATAEIDQYGDSAALVPHAAGGALFSWIKTRLQENGKHEVAQEKSERVHFYPPKAVQNPLPPLGLQKN
jgi:hypothetical protein